MALSAKKGVKKTFKEYEIKPFKGLGQNFLINKGVLKTIINAAKLNSDDIIMEIGPGTGVLTQELAKKTKKVLAIEKDPKMCEILKKTLKEFKNVEIINQNILNYSLPAINYKLIANLPYYITSLVIRKFLENENQPKEMILMVQKEVAQRICSKPPKMNLLAASVQFYAKPEIISYVSKESFWPKPKVESAILKITPYNESKGWASTKAFFKIMKAGFSQPRKQLANNLVNVLKLNKEAVKSWLLKNNIKPEQRAETLEIDDWIKLTKDIK